MQARLQGFFKTFGPGLIFASTAIGVSHLVQSTRAGANYGMAMIYIVTLTNILKYPFFEYGSRYANATGRSLIDGYRQLGKGMLWLYFLITIGSLFFVCGAVGAVTAGFMDNLFGISARVPNGGVITTFALFAICILMLLIGKYRILDSMMKIIGVVMVLSTLVAYLLSLAKGPSPAIEGFVPPEHWEVGFMIALMGWMPTAVDMSTWNSLWTIARIEQSGYKPTLRQTLLDFNIGYIVTSVLAIFFVTLGAYMLYGTGKVMPEGSAGFAHAVVSLYTETMGHWTYIIIAASAFSIMFGTSLAVFDGYARSLERTTELLFLSESKAEQALKNRSFYIGCLLVIGIGSFLVITFFGSSMKKLVDFATTMSFLIAPVIAVANYILVAKRIPTEARPKTAMHVLSWMGILSLTAFSIYFLIYG